MNNFYDNLRSILELQNTIRKLTSPINPVLSNKALMKSITTEAQLVSQIQKIIEESNQSLCNARKSLHPSVLQQSGVMAGVHPYITTMTKSVPRGLVTSMTSVSPESIKYFNVVRPIMNDLSSYVREISILSSSVYIPEQLVPHDCDSSKEPKSEYSENQTVFPTEHVLRKISPVDAVSIISSLIGILLTLISMLQPQNGPTEEQMQEQLDNQTKMIELLQENSHQTHENIDALCDSVEHLTSILSEVQLILEETPEDYQDPPESPGASPASSSDFQSPDPSSDEFRPDKSTSPHEPDVPYNH